MLTIRIIAKMNNTIRRSEDNSFKAAQLKNIIGSILGFTVVTNARNIEG